MNSNVKQIDEFTKMIVQSSIDVPELSIVTPLGHVRLALTITDRFVPSILALSILGASPQSLQNTSLKVNDIDPLHLPINLQDSPSKYMRKTYEQE